MKIRVTQLTVVPENRPIYDESATQVKITDEGGGEFLVVTTNGHGEIKINATEWGAIREAIDQMVKEVQP